MPEVPRKPIVGCVSTDQRKQLGDRKSEDIKNQYPSKENCLRKGTSGMMLQTKKRKARMRSPAFPVAAKSVGFWPSYLFISVLDRAVTPPV